MLDIGLFIAGILFGAFAGPLIFFSIGMILYKLREKEMDSKIESMFAEHDRKIEKLQKRYGKLKEKYANEQKKLRKIVMIDQKTRR